MVILRSECTVYIIYKNTNLLNQTKINTKEPLACAFAQAERV